MEISNPQVFIPILQSTTTMLSSVLTAVVAAWFGRKWLKQEKLKEQLQIAKSDLEFLLTVEATLYEHVKTETGVNLKRKIRASVMSKGFKWSGLNTLSSVKPSSK